MKSPLELRINKSIVMDQVAQFLIATKQVPYNCEITSIEIKIDDSDPINKYKLTIHFKSEELEVVHFDLDNHVPSKPS